MQRYRIFYCPRIFTSSKLRFLTVFIFSIFTFLFIISIIRTPIHQSLSLLDNSISYRQSLDLLNREKVLVPVNINRLYDYQVVCSGSNGILNRNDSINELSKNCQIKFNGSLNINLNPPVDFQIRSSLTSKYVQLWQTKNKCSLFANETIAIIITYRDREKNLHNLLYNLIPLLKQQHIFNYKIFIIEQQTSGAFNKGRLYNIAFYHLMKTYKPTCVIFHDVDLIPENDQNLYSCLTLTDHPLHMSANIRFRINSSYTPIYSFLVGGVLTMRPKTFILLNGYSNEYFNWGGEDDDMGLRFLSKDICVQRPINGYYYAASHSSQTRNKNRFKLLFDAALRQDIDGLTNIDKLAIITNVYEYPLVTWMTVKWIDQSSSVS